MLFVYYLTYNHYRGSMKCIKSISLSVAMLLSSVAGAMDNPAHVATLPESAAVVTAVAVEAPLAQQAAEAVAAAAANVKADAETAKATQAAQEAAAKAVEATQAAAKAAAAKAAPFFAKLQKNVKPEPTKLPTSLMHKGRKIEL